LGDESINLYKSSKKVNGLPLYYPVNDPIIHSVFFKDGIAIFYSKKDKEWLVLEN